MWHNFLNYVVNKMHFSSSKVSSKFSCLRQKRKCLSKLWSGFIQLPPGNTPMRYITWLVAYFPPSAEKRSKIWGRIFSKSRYNIHDNTPCWHEFSWKQFSWFRSQHVCFLLLFQPGRSWKHLTSGEWVVYSLGPPAIGRKTLRNCTNIYNYVISHS